MTLADMPPHAARTLWADICRRYPAPDPPPLRIQVRRSLWRTAAAQYRDPQVVAAFLARAEGRA